MQCTLHTLLLSLARARDILLSTVVCKPGKVTARVVPHTAGMHDSRDTGSRVDVTVLIMSRKTGYSRYIDTVSIEGSYPQSVSARNIIRHQTDGVSLSVLFQSVANNSQFYPWISDGLDSRPTVLKTGRMLRVSCNLNKVYHLHMQVYQCYTFTLQLSYIAAIYFPGFIVFTYPKCKLSCA